jgi:hypothetical protein
MKPGKAVEPRCPDPRGNRPWGRPRICGCAPCVICGWPKHFAVHMAVIGPDGKDIPGMVFNHEYEPKN